MLLKYRTWIHGVGWLWIMYWSCMSHQTWCERWRIWRMLWNIGHLKKEVFSSTTVAKFELELKNIGTMHKWNWYLEWDEDATNQEKCRGVKGHYSKFHSNISNGRILPRMSKLRLKDAACLKITTSSANTEDSDSYLFIPKTAFCRTPSKSCKLPLALAPLPVPGR